MAILEQFRDLTARIQDERFRGSNYYFQTEAVWRLVRNLVVEGRVISIENLDTGDKTDGPTLAGLTQGYLEGYLAESVFQHYVSLFEDFTFGLIGFWLMAYPKGIYGLDDDDSDDKLKKADKTVPLAFITDNPDRERILRAVIDRELDRLKYRRLAAWSERDTWREGALRKTEPGKSKEDVSMVDAEDERWPEFSILFKGLGCHAGGRSYYEDELEEELERLSMGEVVGGGTWMDGSGCDIDIAVRDAQAGLRVIREVLQRLNAPASTRILGDSGEFEVYE